MNIYDDEEGLLVRSAEPVDPMLSSSSAPEYGIFDEDKPFVDNRGMFGDMVSSLYKGSANIIELTGKGIEQVSGVDTGLAGLSELMLEQDLAKVDAERFWAEEDAWTDTLKDTIGSALPSMAPIIAGASAGGALGSIVPGIGTAIGAGLGALSTIGVVFGAGSYKSDYDRNLIDNPQWTEEERVGHAQVEAATEVGYEALGTIASVVTGGIAGGILQSGKGVMKQGLRNLMKSGSISSDELVAASLSRMGKGNIGKALVAGGGMEGVTEVATEIHQVANDRAYGIDRDLINPTAIFLGSMIPGSAISGYTAGKTKQYLNRLEKGINAGLESNNLNTRLSTANAIGNRLEEVDQVDGKTIADSLRDKAQQGPITLDSIIYDKEETIKEQKRTQFDAVTEDYNPILDSAGIDTSGDIILPVAPDVGEVGPQPIGPQEVESAPAPTVSPAAQTLAEKKADREAQWVEFDRVIDKNRDVVNADLARNKRLGIGGAPTYVEPTELTEEEKLIAYEPELPEEQRVKVTIADRKRRAAEIAEEKRIARNIEKAKEKGPGEPQYISDPEKVRSIKAAKEIEKEFPTSIAAKLKREEEALQVAEKAEKTEAAKVKKVEKKAKGTTNLAEKKRLNNQVQDAKDKQEVAKKKLADAKKLKAQTIKEAGGAAQAEAIIAEEVAVTEERATKLEAKTVAEQQAILETEVKTRKQGDWEGGTLESAGKKIQTYKKDKAVILKQGTEAWLLADVDQDGDRVNMGKFFKLKDAQEAHAAGKTAEEWYGKKETKTAIEKRAEEPMTEDQVKLFSELNVLQLVEQAINKTGAPQSADAAISAAIMDAAKVYDPKKTEGSFKSYAKSRATNAARDYMKSDIAQQEVSESRVSAVSEEGKVTSAITEATDIEGPVIVVEKAEKREEAAPVTKIDPKQLIKDREEAAKKKEEAKKAKNLAARKKIADEAKAEKEAEAKRAKTLADRRKKRDKELADKGSLGREDKDLKQEDFPKQKEGTIRVYRASSPTIKFEDVFDKKKLKKFDNLKEGEVFWTDDLDYANYFRETYGRDATIGFLDLTPEQAKLYKRGKNEYGISEREEADQAPDEDVSKYTPEEQIALQWIKGRESSTAALDAFNNATLSKEQEPMRAKVVKILEQDIAEQSQAKAAFEVKYPDGLAVLTEAARSPSTDKVTARLSKFLLDTANFDRLNSIKVVMGVSNSYTPSTNTITLQEKAGHETMLHEVIHGLTSQEISNNPELKKRVNKLMKTAKAHALKKGFLTASESRMLAQIKTSEDFKASNLNKETSARQRTYGFLNEKEFLSEAFSNKEFQDFLKTVKIPGDKHNNTLWKRLLSYIGTALGIDPKDYTVLEEIILLVPEISDIGMDIAEVYTLEVDESINAIPASKTRAEQVDVMRRNDLRDKPVDQLKDWGKKAGSFMKDVGKGVTERIRKIDHTLIKPLRDMEFGILEDNKKYQDQIKDFVDGYNKMSKDDKLMLDLTLMNREEEDIAERTKILRRNRLTGAYKKVEGVLLSIHKAKGQVGLNNYKDVADYFPRRVKDVRALMQTIKDDPTYNVIQAELDRMGEDATQTDKENAIQQMINTGRFPALAMLEPSSSKRRTIRRVSSEWKHHYDNSVDALVNHIYESNEAVHARRLFGDNYRRKRVQKRDQLYKELEGTAITAKKTREKKVSQILAIEAELENYDTEWNNGISSMLLKKAPELKGDRADTVIRLIRGRLAQKGMHGPMASIRNVALMSVLSSPTSAITQIGDLAFSIYKYGPSDTVKAILGDKLITSKDLDLTGSMKEFQQTGTAKWLDKTLKWSGLQMMDNFGKNTTMQASINSAKKLSLTQFTEKFGEYYGKDTIDTYNELKANKNTQLTRFFAFNELSEMQPVSMSEMPLKYLEAGNGRIMYALKSYNIKAMNVIYRESVHAWRTSTDAKGKAKAAKNVGRLVFLMTMAGATADELKDFLLGKDAGTFSDGVWDNLLKMAFMSRYTLEQGANKGLIDTLLTDILAPPLGFIDDPIRDIYSVWKGEADFRTLQNLPWGKLPYNWFSAVEEGRDMKNVKEQVTEQYSGGKSISAVRSDMNKYNAWARQNDEALMTFSTLNKARKKKRKEDRK